jgi:hypothetical protein
MLKTYTGSCHCGRVKYRAEIDLAAGAGRCNCSYCSKIRNWSATIKPERFELLTGADDLSDYQFASRAVHHRFCRHCGVRLFSDGFVEAIGGAFVSISLATLDDASARELIDAPLRWFNGRDNAWLTAPAEVRHL